MSSRAKCDPGHGFFCFFFFLTRHETRVTSDIVFVFCYFVFFPTPFPPSLPHQCVLVGARARVCARPALLRMPLVGGGKQQQRQRRQQRTPSAAWQTPLLAPSGPRCEGARSGTSGAVRCVAGWCGTHDALAATILTPELLVGGWMNRAHSPEECQRRHMRTPKGLSPKCK